MGPWWLTWHLCLYIYEKCEMSRLWRTHGHTDGQWESRAVFSLNWIRNLIRKKTGCDEYPENQLNVASKNLAKYPFDEKDGKKNLEGICSMKAWSDKKNYFEFFFLAWSYCLTRQISYLSDPPFALFLRKYLIKYITISLKPNIHSKIRTLLHHLGEK